MKKFRLNQTIMAAIIIITTGNNLFCSGKGNSAPEDVVREFSPDDISSFTRQISELNLKDPIDTPPIDQEVETFAEQMDPSLEAEILNEMLTGIARDLLEITEEFNQNGSNIEDEIKQTLSLMYDNENEVNRLTPLIIDLMRGMTRK